MRDTPTDVLHSSDQRKIASLFSGEYSEAFDAVSGAEKNDILFGQSIDDTKTLRIQLKTSATQTTRLIDLTQSLQNNSIDELAAVAHFEGIEGIANTASYVRAARNNESKTYNEDAFIEAMQGPEKVTTLKNHYGISDPKRMARREQYSQHIKNQLALGYTPADIRTQVENRKIWDTFTPHPTKDKNAYGQNGLNTLARATANKIVDGLKTMIGQPLTPRVKDELSDETNTGLHNLNIHIDGAVDYLEDLQWALDDALEENTFDVRDTAIDVAPRDWYAGDADGKLVPASVLFSKRLQGAQRGAEKYLDILNAVPETGRGPLAPTIEAFEKLSYRLGKIETDPEKLKGNALKIAIDNFDKAFTDAGFRDPSKSIGPNWTGEMMTALREVSENEALSLEARNAARRVTLMHKQVGVSLGRQEIRHSGDDYNQIFQNVYSYLAENPDRVPGLKIKKGTSLEGLSTEQQIEFYKKFIGAENRRELLHVANHELDKDGKEVSKLKGPATEVLARFEVVQKTFNKRRTGVAIIAEANEMSCIQQQILAEAHHIQGMTHCALNEDENTIKDAAKNLGLYLKTTGHNNLQFKIEEIDQGEDHPKIYVCVMDPASDSHKSWGIGMKSTQNESLAAVSSLGLEFGVAALEKIGTGCSYARGGFPAEMAPRLHMHALSKAMDLRNLSETSRKILKRQMSFVSLTIQGRGPGLLRGSRDQVQDALAKIGFEMDAACMAIDGLIKPKDIAPMAVKYSPEMQKFLDEVKQNARTHYHDVMRHELSNDVLGAKIEDIHVDQTSATMMALLTNVSARKASRDDDDKTIPKLKNKDTGEQRAIGQNVAKEWTGSLYDGWFEVGRVLTQTREAVGNQTIHKSQVKKLAGDEFFLRHECGNAMLALAKADLEEGFDEIAYKKGTLSNERWTVGKVLNAVESNFKGLDEAETRQAQIAYEGLMASSHMEWLLTEGKAAKPAEQVSAREIILRVYDENDTLEKTKFGPKTKKKFVKIEDTQQLAQQDKLMRAMTHECERRLRDMASNGNHLEEGSEEIQKYRHIAMARRTASGPITMPNLMDTHGVTFGARKEPIVSMIANWAVNKTGLKPKGPDEEYRPAAE